MHGHLIARTNPVGYQLHSNPDLNVESYGLTLWDLDRVWPTGGFGDKEQLPLRTILARLREAYAGTLAVEYMYMEDRKAREWFQEKLEHGYSKPSRERLMHVLEKLVEAEPLRPSCRPSTWVRSVSHSKAESRSFLCWMRSSTRRQIMICTGSLSVWRIVAASMF